MACAVRAREPASVFPGLAAPRVATLNAAVLDVPVSVRVEASVVEARATVKVGGQVSTADAGSVQTCAADTGPVMRRRMNVIVRRRGMATRATSEIASTIVAVMDTVTTREHRVCVIRATGVWPVKSATA